MAVQPFFTYLSGSALLMSAVGLTYAIRDVRRHPSSKSADPWAFGPRPQALEKLRRRPSFRLYTFIDRTPRRRVAFALVLFGFCFLNLWWALHWTPPAG